MIKPHIWSGECAQWRNCMAMKFDLLTFEAWMCPPTNIFVNIMPPVCWGVLETVNSQTRVFGTYMVHMDVVLLLTHHRVCWNKCNQLLESAWIGLNTWQSVCYTVIRTPNLIIITVQANSGTSSSSLNAQVISYTSGRANVKGLWSVTM